MKSKSEYTNANSYLNKVVQVVMDRPLGTKHPKYDFPYPVNYGYVPGTLSGDSEELDAYVLGLDKPVEKFSGVCIAIIHRLDDNDDKLVVVPDGIVLNNDEIENQVEFQEKWFKHIIVR